MTLFFFGEEKERNQVPEGSNQPSPTTFSVRSIFVYSGVMSLLSVHRICQQGQRRVLASLSHPLPGRSFYLSSSSSLASSFSSSDNFRQRFHYANHSQSRFTSSSAASSTTKDNDNDETKVAVVKKKPFLLDLGLPQLIPEWKKMFNTETLFTDISAGLTVGCIAVPLSLAIAVASGVPAEVGLVRNRNLDTKISVSFFVMVGVSHIYYRFFFSP